jgi:hypothetical protein
MDCAEGSSTGRADQNVEPQLAGPSEFPKHSPNPQRFRVDTSVQRQGFHPLHQ